VGAESAGQQGGGSDDAGSVERLHGALLDGRLRVTGAHRIRPLLDVITDGTSAEKLDALSVISKHYAPALAPALRRALEDPDASVRVLAATVMAQQNNNHTRRIGALQAAARGTPDLASTWRALGEAQLAYAESGLLDTRRADAEASQAYANLARAGRLEPPGAETSRGEAKRPPAPRDERLTKGWPEAMGSGALRHAT
jgi:hypothetical protein